TVLVVGVGYVGRHLVERFSDACDVVGLDLSASRCDLLCREFKADGLSNITMISDIEQDERCSTFDLALISVPTLLLADNKTVDTKHIRAAVEVVSQRARPGSTVVIESSVTVGMTRALLGPEGANLRARGIFVGFSPERVDPGRTLPRFEDIPKVVSGIDDASLAAITRLYSRSFNSVVPVRSLETAEFCKLYENCQRLMLITYVNEMADACEQHGVNIHDVCAASATKPFGFTPFNPSLGAGGHCIPVNCWYLLQNCEIPVLRAAAVSNRQRPARKAKEIALLAHERNSRAGDHPPSVLIYGMGFKAGEASLAYAPTVTLARELEEQGCRVSYFDDYVKTEEWRSLPREAFNSYRVDALFDIVVVAQKPSFSDRRVLDELSSARVI
ncbi:nucleotide sugar dehydrogenase, partial [Jaminaea rosea]